MEGTNVQPKTYLVESILVTLFCCLPLGIVGIINAAKVSSLFAQGQYEAAVAASEAAKKWTKYGAIAGVIVIVISLILRVTIFSVALSNAH